MRVILIHNSVALIDHSRQINQSGWTISSKAVKRQMVPQWEYHGGNLLRLLNKWGTSETERKEWMYQQTESRTAYDKEPSELSRRAVGSGTHTDIWNTTEQFEKRTHTSDTRESLPARRNYLDLSISVSRTIRIPSHSHLELVYFLSLSHSIHSWLCIWMDSDCFLPSNSAALEGWSRWQLHAFRSTIRMYLNEANVMNECTRFRVE